MAQTTLPTNEPVFSPQASPGEFASAGATVAEMGQETANMAMANTAFEGHLAEAQRYLKLKQIEINVGAMQDRAHEALSKAVTTEDAQQVHQQFTQEVSQALGPYQGDKVLARQLHLYGQQVNVEMQHTVNARKATIIQRDDDAANATLYKDAVRESVNVGAANGDPDVPLDKLHAKLMSSVAMGTMYPDQVDKVMEKAHTDVEKGIIKAQSNSPDSQVRKANIAKLKSGQGFKYLDDADINAALSAAEKRDRELSNIADSEDYNANLTKFNELSAGLTFEGKSNLLSNDDWLRTNFPDDNGNPNHKMAKLIQEDVDRQEARQKKIQGEKDTDIISKYQSDADTGKLSVPQIDKLVREQGGSPRAADALKRDLHQHVSESRAEAHFGEFLSKAGERTSRRDAKANGEKEQAFLFRAIDNGVTVDMDSVWDKVDAGEMTTAQALKVDSHIKAQRDTAYKYNSTRIANAPGLSDKAKADLTLQLLDAKTQQGLKDNEMNAFTDKLLADHGKKQTSNYVQDFFNNLLKPPAAKGVTTTPETKQYKVGDTKINSNGDTVKLTDKGWTVQ